MLRDYVEPFVLSSHGGLNHVVFQQDNCGLHRAKFV